MRLERDKALTQCLGLYLCSWLEVFIPIWVPFPDRGLGMGEAKDPSPDPTGSWLRVGQHSWSRVDPEPPVASCKGPTSSGVKGDNSSLQGPGNCLAAGAKGTGDPDVRSS